MTKFESQSRQVHTEEQSRARVNTRARFRAGTHGKSRRCLRRLFLGWSSPSDQLTEWFPIRKVRSSRWLGRGTVGCSLILAGTVGRRFLVGSRRFLVDPVD